MKPIHFIGAGMGMGANRYGCQFGPEHYMTSPQWKELRRHIDLASICLYHELQELSTKEENIASICLTLADHTRELTSHHSPFISLGGDHSCAIGTWSGVSTALRAKGPLGLIWIDAHMDAHTDQTSHTHNIHGMPVAALLGHGSYRLTHILSAHPKLLPENLCLVGVRDFEIEEKILLDRLGVKIFYNTQVQEEGIDAVLAQALSIVTKNTYGYGISLDLDVIDPTEAPAVGTPAPHGLHGTELCNALLQIHGDNQLLGFEIAEYNPSLDKEFKTARLITQLIVATFSGKLI